MLYNAIIKRTLLTPGGFFTYALPATRLGNMAGCSGVRTAFWKKKAILRLVQVNLYALCTLIR